RGESRMTPAIARKVMDQFRVLAASPGAPRPAATDGGEDELDRLTGKEEQILQLIAQGMSNRQISAKVFLAEGTVKNYVSRIMEKLHARTRTELAVMALRSHRVD
ncbi:MAG: response regulator transcription factor, partial [Rhodocyclaceae bacterium]